MLKETTIKKMMNGAETANDEINEFKKRRDTLFEDKNNHWRVYSICKNINEVAELEGVSFKTAPLEEKLKLAHKLLNFVEFEVFYEGVIEYHASTKYHI